MTSVPTIRLDISIAGDLEQAKQVCREYCFDVGLCVTVEPVAYIYTGGEEAGVRVSLINYPRFPSDEAELLAKAGKLADLLMVRLCQHSYSIVGPKETVNIDRSDNRWRNLRLATNSQNQANRPARRSLPKGVTQLGQGKFQAQIKCDGKNHYLGLFGSSDDAHGAYLARAAELFGDFVRAA